MKYYKEYIGTDSTFAPILTLNFHSAYTIDSFPPYYYYYFIDFMKRPIFTYYPSLAYI